MANPYFQFKQFTIHQDQCAMKVCTDACIFGAWFADKIPDHSTILDVGSGTGLLMMMLAQRSRSEVHGIELDLSSFKQLKENINQNKWRERLKVFPGDARTYSFPVKYDFIIANPPFFENDLPSESGPEQVAKHSKELTLDELVKLIDNNLEPHGSFGILLPFHRWEGNILTGWSHIPVFIFPRNCSSDRVQDIAISGQSCNIAVTRTNSFPLMILSFKKKMGPIPKRLRSY
jgi:tRNA1Val (adenine37-N6)-methyltransferase